MPCEGVAGCLFTSLLPACRFTLPRLVQKDVGQEGESLWFLATDSLAAEDTAAWPRINPAAARQLLGGFSSLTTVSKQCARAQLLVSNTLPLKVGALAVMLVLWPAGLYRTGGQSERQTSARQHSVASFGVLGSALEQHAGVA